MNTTNNEQGDVYESEIMSEPLEKSEGSMEAKNKRWWLNNRGALSVELILILCILVAIAVIFNEQITSLVQSIWRSISGSAGKII